MTGTRHRSHAEQEKPVALKYLLFARGAFNLLFGLLILASMEGFAAPVGGGVYAAIDGLLALAVAVALIRSRARWLFALALVDALIRVGYGAMLLANPWIQKTVGTGRGVRRRPDLPAHRDGPRGHRLRAAGQAHEH